MFSRKTLAFIRTPIGNTHILLLNITFIISPTTSVRQFTNGTFAKPNKEMQIIRITVNISEITGKKNLKDNNNPKPVF